MKYGDLKTQRVDLAKAIPLAKPFALLLEPICACNFRCKWCYYSITDIRNIMPPGKMETDQFQKILEDLSNWNGDPLKVVRIIGFGEPMLHKELGVWVKLIREANIADRIEITSNCSLLTADLSSCLIQNGLDYLRVSIYAGTQSKFEAITGSKMRLSCILDSLKKLQELKRRLNSARPYVYVKMLDDGDADENNRFFSQFGIVANEIALEQPHNWLDGGNVGSRLICPQPFKMLSIRWNGDVIVCDPDYQNRTCVGNALQENIKDIWHGKRLIEFQRMQLEGRRYENESCRNCSFINNGNYVLDDIDCLKLDKLELCNDRT